MEMTMASKSGNKSQVHELLYQALETEMGGILIYQAAISCATNKDLRKEWEGYLEETQTHHEVLLNVFKEQPMPVWLPLLKASLPYVTQIVATAIPAFTAKPAEEKNR